MCCIIFFGSPMVSFSFFLFGGGFKELAPDFSIHNAGSDQYRLPTSSTCVNLLKVSSQPPPFSFFFFFFFFLTA